jgi:hypothetical protein
MSKQKEIIVSSVRVKGYVKHANGKKTLFDFNKHDFKPESLEKIFEELGGKYQ